ncbi:MAG: UTRA domain-containing protein, partial [Gammaproteobacteria bacterium]
TRELLGMRSGEPCLQLTRRTWSRGRVVTQAILVYPGDRYELGARYATDE